MAAVDDAIASLLTRVVAQYLTNGGYVTLFPQDMASVALIAQYVAQQASAAGSSATLAAGSLAAAQAITGGGQGIGTEPLDLPRVVEHGRAAFAEIDSIRGLFPLLVNAAYQIVLQDFGKMVFCTSGTNTYTFPAAADLPDGWFCRLRNRSGANLTLNPTGADTINGSASLAIATGSAILTAVRTAAGTFEVA